MGINQVQSLLFDGTKAPDQKDLSIEEKFKLKEKEFNNFVKQF